MLRLVTYKKNSSSTLDKDYPGLNPSKDHQHLIERYFKSQKVQNHSIRTITKEKSFLDSWFKLHGREDRQLFFWEAMQPIVGRTRIINYVGALVDSGLASSTIRSYLGILSRYFNFILGYPYFIDGEITSLIRDRYNDLEQPISEYDYPVHVYNGEKLGVPFDPEKLYEFYNLMRDKYLSHSKNEAFVARNYAMLVVAGESGLRIDEIINLEIEDLLFDSKKIQTRYAKGTKGSGKRARTTLFTPLAQDTMKFYLKIRKEYIDKNDSVKYVFPTKTGNKLSYTSVRLALKEMVGIAKKEKFLILPHMSWHWMRRIFATRFIERFPNQLHILLTLLGHIGPGTVHNYIRHSDAWMDDKIKEMLERF